MKIINLLKERHKRTALRRLDDGIDLEFDEKKGIINKETKEVIIDISLMYYNANDKDEGSEDDNKIITNEEDIDENDENDLSDKNYNNNNIKENNKENKFEELKEKDEK